MNLKRIKEKHIFTICMVLLVIAICAIAIACKNNKKYTQTSNN
jgi:hypothetical protein